MPASACKRIRVSFELQPSNTNPEQPILHVSAMHCPNFPINTPPPTTSILTFKPTKTRINPSVQSPPTPSNQWQSSLSFLLPLHSSSSLPTPQSTAPPSRSTTKTEGNRVARSRSSSNSSFATARCT